MAGRDHIVAKLLWMRVIGPGSVFALVPAAPEVVRRRFRCIVADVNAAARYARVRASKASASFCTVSIVVARLPVNPVPSIAAAPTCPRYSVTEPVTVPS